MTLAKATTFKYWRGGAVTLGTAFIIMYYQIVSIFIRFFTVFNEGVII